MTLAEFLLYVQAVIKQRRAEAGHDDENEQSVDAFLAWRASVA